MVVAFIEMDIRGLQWFEKDAFRIGTDSPPVAIDAPFGTIESYTITGITEIDFNIVGVF